MYLTVSELETRAYLAGNTALSDALAQLEDSQLQIDQLESELKDAESESLTAWEQIDQLESELKDAESESLTAWERNNGPAQAYMDFFFECFDRLAVTGGRYPCPSISSDYDKSIIFDAIEGNTK